MHHMHSASAVIVSHVSGKIVTNDWIYGNLFAQQVRPLQAPFPFQAFRNGRLVYTAKLVVILVIIYIQQGVDERCDELVVFVQVVCSRGKLCICRGADAKGFRTHEGSFSGSRLQEEHRRCIPLSMCVRTDACPILKGCF